MKKITEDKSQQELFRQALMENDKKIYRICCYYFSSREEAGDTYQEILLKIWLSINSFRGEAKLSTWVNRIAVNTCLTHLSKKNRTTEVIIPFSSRLPSDEPADDIGENDISERKIQFFNDFKSRLGKADRMLVTLYLEDIEYREIAEITGLSEVNARARIHRIKKQVKEEWEEIYGT